MEIQTVRAVALLNNEYIEHVLRVKCAGGVACYQFNRAQIETLSKQFLEVLKEEPEKRKLNSVILEINGGGEWFAYGRVGSENREVIVTLQYISEGEDLETVRLRWEKYVGRLWREVEKETLKYQRV